MLVASIIVSAIVTAKNRNGGKDRNSYKNIYFLKFRLNIMLRNKLIKYRKYNLRGVFI